MARQRQSKPIGRSAALSKEQSQRAGGCRGPTPAAQLSGPKGRPSTARFAVPGASNTIVTRALKVRAAPDLKCQISDDRDSLSSPKESRFRESQTLPAGCLFFRNWCQAALIANHVIEIACREADEVNEGKRPPGHMIHPLGRRLVTRLAQ